MFYSTFLITFIVLLVHDVYRTFILLLSYFYYTFISVLTDGAAEDAAGAERERRGGWVVDGGYAALVPCASGKGWVGCEEGDSGLGVVVWFHKC